MLQFMRSQRVRQDLETEKTTATEANTALKHLYCNEN